MLPEFTYIRARSVKEALAQLDSAGARLHAGGTDLLGCLRDDVFTADKVVSISGLKELQGVQETADGRVRIGALVTVTALAGDATIKEKYPALAQAAASVASPQLRNRGTIGGNLCQKPRCWYYRGEFHCSRKGGDLCYAAGGENQYHCIFGGEGCYIVHPSDLAPALVAYGAVLRVAGAKGTRNVPVEEFFLLPARNIRKENILGRGEMVTDIILPRPDAAVRSAYRKVRARRSWDFALAGVALAIRFNGNQVAQAHIVLSGAAPIPWRCVAAEKAVAGRKLTPGVAAEAAAIAVKGARPLEHNAFKIHLFQGLLEEELNALTPS
jgi:xanthine dehydrogenase YagS FAD-binding subunit